MQGPSEDETPTAPLCISGPGPLDTPLGLAKMVMHLEGSGSLTVNGFPNRTQVPRQINPPLRRWVLVSRARYSVCFGAARVNEALVTRLFPEGNDAPEVGFAALQLTYDDADADGVKHRHELVVGDGR